MILQSLVDLYERRRDAEDPDQRLPEPGWQEKEMDLRLSTGPEGRPVQCMIFGSHKPKAGRQTLAASPGSDANPSVGRKLLVG